MKEDIPTSLKNYCQSMTASFEQIPQDRQNLLKKLGKYIAGKVHDHQDIHLVVICTHNSRRSHVGQLWLQTASQWYDVQKVKTYSGGTEATAFNKNAVAALQRVGFEISSMNQEENPKYKVTIPIHESVSMTCFSKTYDSPPNPKKDFAAIMVCSEADRGCPIVSGADARFPIPYNDPKNYDHTPQETQKYDECVQQIGREFFFVFHHATEILNQTK